MSQLIIIIVSDCLYKFLKNSLPSCVSASLGVATTHVMQLKILTTRLVRLLRRRSKQLGQQFPSTQKNKLERLLRGSLGDFSDARKRMLKLKI